MIFVAHTLNLLFRMQFFDGSCIFRPPVRKKGDKKPLSVENASKIIAYSKMGLSSREIKKRMLDDFGIHITKSTVSNILKRQTERGTISRLKNPGSGRPRKTSKRTDRVIKKIALSTRKQSFAEVARKTLESTGVRLSIDTIRRRLLEYDIRSCICARKPLLSKANRKKDANGLRRMRTKESIFGKPSCGRTKVDFVWSPISPNDA